jgi:predicted nucleotidyltransferase
MALPDCTPMICERLTAIELAHRVGVLYACESGSRAWGFASPDSDWDVRFIYLHASDWYLSLIDWKEVIELPIEGNLDINGWDFRKSLKLLLKGNPVLFEWLASPIVYREDQTVMVRYRELAQHLFRPRRASSIT